MLPKSRAVSSARQPVFFFQAEDGIRDIGVTGVQTCALPIFAHVEKMEKSRRTQGQGRRTAAARPGQAGRKRLGPGRTRGATGQGEKIGRASCRERSRSPGSWDT